MNINEGILDSFKLLVKKIGLKYGIEMFRTPEEIREASEIYAAIKQFYKGHPTERIEVETFMEDLLEKYNISQDRKQIYWNAAITLWGHLVRGSGNSKSLGIYGSR